ncbi:MAG: NifB/NifX family molybdenum-iron cluster-binding protein [Limnochordia bacterium]|jgi:predicted Fe-Mo cluster-binding NifX family protein|nr:dinitrogenase iron-molybdenum cofactor [Bacillota bacterium]
MKIAIATANGAVSPHFGHCPEFTLALVEKGQVKEMETLPSPGHRPGVLPEFLAEQGASVVIAGGMGARAQELFRAKDIETIIGAQGPVREVLAAYLAGSLQVGEDACDHGRDRP